MTWGLCHYHSVPVLTCFLTEEIVLSFSNVMSGVKSGPLISNVIRTYPAVYIPYDKREGHQDIPCSVYPLR